MINWEYDNGGDAPKKQPTPRKKVVKKGKADSSSAMDTVEGDDNIIKL